jgi:hypothetical protein
MAMKGNFMPVVAAGGQHTPCPRLVGPTWGYIEPKYEGWLSPWKKKLLYRHMSHRAVLLVHTLTKCHNVIF